MINKKTKRDKSFKKKILLILIVILICIFILGCFLVLRDKANLVKDNDIETLDKSKEEIMNKLVKLNKKNKDVFGYIELNNSKISYPVLYSGDDYYLRRDYNKDYKREGSIYVDKHNSLSDLNLIIHGHNLDTGTMFTDLLKYKEEAYYKKHKVFSFYTISDGYSEYEVLAVFLSKVYEKDDEVFKYYKYYGDLDEEKYNEYIRNVKELSLYDTGVVSKYPEKLITLSTCEFSRENGRMVVVLKEIS